MLCRCVKTLKYTACMSIAIKMPAMLFIPLQNIVKNVTCSVRMTVMHCQTDLTPSGNAKCMKGPFQKDYVHENSGC
jgi:hypothetical protein